LNSQYTTGWAWNNIIKTTDEETYGQADGEFKFDSSLFKMMKFGVALCQSQTRRRLS